MDETSSWDGEKFACRWPTKGARNVQENRYWNTNDDKVKVKP